MKRLISLLLALLLLASAAAAAFTDEKSIGAKYRAAVTAMSEKGIIGGFTDGSFKPADTLTRAQAAKILCTMLAGDAIPDAAAEFTDVPAGHWASKFIAYCAQRSIVSGVGGGKFNPDGKLTACAFAKMLLVAYGHDAEKEGLVGEKWVSGTQKAMRQDGMNYNVTAADDPIARQMACQMAYNFVLFDEIKKADPAAYPDARVSFAKGDKVKVGGRGVATENGVVLNFPGDYVEFTLRCKGHATLHYTSDESAYFTCFVDGVEFGRRLKTSATTTEGVSYQFILPGEHTIRIVRDSEVSTTGKTTTLTGLDVSCAASTLAATAQKKHYIEYVGDSITAGCGTLGDNKTPWSDSTHAGSKAYSYMTSELLDADFALIAKGGIGFTKPASGVSVEQMFTRQQAWRDKDAKANTTRQPDIIVCAIAANDDRADPDTVFHDEMVKFAAVMRQRAPQAKIVFIYNLMSDKHAETIRTTCVELGGAAKNYYEFEMLRGNNGVPAKTSSSGHPSVADNVKSSAALAEFLKPLLG